jgi:hypothetical protein
MNFVFDQAYGAIYRLQARQPNYDVLCKEFPQYNLEEIINKPDMKAASGILAFFGIPLPRGLA